MGLYPIDCLGCHKPFMWFSGDPSQVCGDCKKKMIDLRTKELVEQHIDGLTDEERLRLFNKYCKACGTKDIPCSCQRDD